MDFRKVGVWTVTIFVGAIFLMSGASKLAQLAGWQARALTKWGLPGWFAVIVPLLEVAGGLLILLPRTAVAGGAALVVVMIGATWANAVAGDYMLIPVTVALGCLAGFVAWYRGPWCRGE